MAVLDSDLGVLVKLFHEPARDGGVPCTTQ